LTRIRRKEQVAVVDEQYSDESDTVRHPAFISCARQAVGQLATGAEANAASVKTRFSGHITHCTTSASTGCKKTLGTSRQLVFLTPDIAVCLSLVASCLSHRLQSCHSPCCLGILLERMRTGGSVGLFLALHNRIYLFYHVDLVHVSVQSGYFRSELC
ncbi:hypothetical protein KCU66_g63, partial [Aureobasidium melanogenum]